MVKWTFAEHLRGETESRSGAKRAVEAWARGEPVKAVNFPSYVFDEKLREKLVIAQRGSTMVLSWRRENA